MIFKHGLTSLLLLHGYFEVWAFILTLDSAFRISKLSLKKYRKQLDINLRDIVIHELMKSFPQIVILLLVAAILEVFWGPIVLMNY